MQRGDHIKVQRFGYTHHGIYLGSGWVIHYTGEVWWKILDTAGLGIPGKLGTPVPKVQRDKLNTFRAGAKASVVSHQNNKAHVAIVIRRAESRVGESGYNLIWNNCEHFATWCVTGRAESKQVQSVARNGGGAMGATAAISVATTAAAAVGAAAVAPVALPVAAAGVGVAAAVTLANRLFGTKK